MGHNRAGAKVQAAAGASSAAGPRKAYLEERLAAGSWSAVASTRELKERGYKELLLQGRIVCGAHEEDFGRERHKVLRAQFGPLGVGVEGGPARFPRCAVFVGEKVNERVRIVEVLPDGHHVHAAFLEHVNLSFPEPPVQFVDAAFELAHAISRRIYGVHAQFKATRILGCVLAEVALDVRAARCRRTLRSALAGGGRLSGLRVGRRENALGREKVEAKACYRNAERKTRKCETCYHSSIGHTSLLSEVVCPRR